ncbi:MAG: tRNA threonylcarbamoyladenosine dehydratase [Treponema sp.]|nr:tRNA threonylcarbamoyladenosine dehydratase [Treponema sp.]
MNEQFLRTSLVLGESAIDILSSKKVIVFGIGGVGGFVAEALARSGIGKLTLVDNDVVSESNINRQIIALHSTINKYKVDVMKERLFDINPNMEITTKKCFFLPENESDIDYSLFDYVVDAVDTVTAKICIIEKAKKNNVPVISCMGTVNKLNPMGFKIADISKTSVCPLARVLRKELKNRNIKNVKVVYSEEKPAIVTKEFPGSLSFVPGAAGFLIASEVVKDLLNIKV